MEEITGDLSLNDTSSKNCGIFCKHVDFIKRKFIKGILHISHDEVLRSELDICYIPGCNSSKILTTPSDMGDPPMKTVSPINFVGIGLKTNQSTESLMNKWYISYLPINLNSMGNDLYNIYMRLVDIIGTGSLFKTSSIDKSYQLPWHDKPFIFTTPSCSYAGLDELSSILDYPNLGCKLQLVIQVLEKPGSYNVNKRSLYYETHEDRGKDKHFLDDEIEWHSTSIDTIIPLRLLVRILPPKAQTFAQKNGVLLQLSKSKTNIYKIPERIHSDKYQNINLYLSIPVYSGEDGLELVREESFAKLKGCIKNKVCLQWYRSVDNCLDIVDYILTSSVNCDGFTRGVSLEDEQYGVLSFTLPWCNDQNRILFYFKSLLNSRHIEWSPNERIWKIPSIHIYTVAKFVHHLGGSIDQSVESHLASFLGRLKSKTVDVYEELTNTSVWKYIHILLSSGKCQQLNLTFYPFDKRMVELAKASKMKWNQFGNMWEMQSVQLPQFISQLKCKFDRILPSDKLNNIATQYGVKIQNSTNITTRITQKNSFIDRVSVKRRVKRDRDEVTCILMTAAGKEPHIHRIATKIMNVVNTISPPTSSIDESGNLSIGGPGTGGIKFIQSPRGIEEWNQISFCVIPSGGSIDDLINRYDINILCSLVGEVFIFTEKALDWLLENCDRWPDPSDSIKYKNWNDVMVENEGILWDGHDFNSRQQLAQERLFCDEEFHVVGVKNDPTTRLCTLLIKLGNGKIVSDPKDAEYVIITDSKSNEALEMKSKFWKNDEDLISRTHGAKHSTLVTPKFIYDCITTWKLQRPSRGQKHLAF